MIQDCANALMQKYPQVKITVHQIKNEYFGGNVSVAGLITGTDIIKQCTGRLHSDLLTVPEVMVRDEKGQFLDDITLGCSSAKRSAAALSASPPMAAAAARRG